MKNAVRLALACGVVSSVQAQSGTTVQIAHTSQVAPSTGGRTFSSFGVPALNDGGTAMFTGVAVDTIGSPAVTGIFGGANGTPKAIVLKGQSAPGTGGGTFSAFSPPAVNANGTVAFRADVAGGAAGFGIFTSNGVTPTAIAVQAQGAPDTGGGTFSAMFLPSLSASGAAAFTAFANGGSASQGIFRGAGGAPVALAVLGEPASGTTTGTFSDFTNTSTPTVNANGAAAFIANVSGGTAGIGVFIGAGAAGAVALQNQTVPDTGGGKFDGFYGEVSLNDGGAAAFLASVNGGTSTQGIFRGGSGALTTIALQGQVAPSTGSGTFSAFGSPSLNASGAAAFRAEVANGSSSLGIFRGVGGTPSALIVAGQSAPGTGSGKFSNFSDPAINDFGTTATFSSVTGGTAADGIFLSDGQETIVAVVRGQTVSGAAVSALNFTGGVDLGGRSGLNNFGQVAYGADFLGGGSGIFVFTPTVHYRKNVSGNWDDNANWTLSLKPGTPHDVILDPSASVTIAGPATATTIRSLQIGGGTGTAVLDLAAGAPLTVTNGLRVAAGGVLKGTGASSGSVTNAGLVTPGDSPGTLAITGSFLQEQTGTLRLELGGLAPGTGFDRLQTTATLTLAGTLDVVLFGGFKPAAGNSFDVLDWGTLSGTFDTINLPSLATSLSWDTSALYTRGVLSVVPEPESLGLLLGGLSFCVARRRIRR